MIYLADAEATEAFGRRIAGTIEVGDIVALFGELGAGKTTLARGIIDGLGHAGDIASPTFPIVQVYDEPRVPVWHVDLYRVEDPRAIEQLGLDEALDEAALLIEWPERLGTGLWGDALRLSLATVGEGARALTAMVPPAWEGRWPPR
ncbi:MAG: tRNA (adenosine(37)-N6)-threonylcarbamoyltransferase complex ATPase subunit type 1 TsaE [Pseudomonadota bacterium]|nr:tRNA (adenosine(37)-N6)-threonylcarbamoyltransferase complex ATPase subunit type 1 TsaE [Pseudomonadota bacterium]